MIPTVTEKPKKTKESIGVFFLDSGAHSLYTREVIKKKDSEGYAYYKTKEFWKYVDAYAAFVKEHQTGIDYFANVDVIFEPKLTYDVQMYMEKEHGLRPVPVVHYGTDLKWLDKYIEGGHDYIGLGGLGQRVTKQEYYGWADKVYNVICNNAKRLPIVRTHGFAMTAYHLLLRYPWWSVDSASWGKVGAYGQIYVPRKKNGKYSFDVRPYVMSVSEKSPYIKKHGRHIYCLSKQESNIIREWIEQVGVPFGSVDKKGEMIEWGVCSHHSARKIVNLHFFQALCNSLPQWPWPFEIRKKHRLF